MEIQADAYYHAYDAPEDEKPAVIDQLESFAVRKDISPTALKEKVKAIPKVLVQNSHVLHNICANNKVTPEIVEFLLDFAPASANVLSGWFVPSFVQDDRTYGDDVHFSSDITGQDAAYPIHIACLNDECPGTVIEMLAKKNPSALNRCCALRHGSRKRNPIGLPLHLYLSRASNINIDTAIKLVSANQNALNTGAIYYTEHNVVYPLQVACLNDKCQGSIIEMLVMKNPSALSQFCALRRWDDVKGEYQKIVHGLPLHHYLSRRSGKDIETYKVLISHYQNALVTVASNEKDESFLPIEIILSCPEVGSLDAILQEMISFSLHSFKVPFDISGRFILHRALSNGNITCGIVRMLVENFPELVREKGEARHEEDLPIHWLCRHCGSNEIELLAMLQLFLDEYHQSVQAENSRGLLPIHLAIRRRSVPFCKLLMEEYPESMLIGNAHNWLAFHYACKLGSFDVIQHLFEQYPDVIDIPAGNDAFVERRGKRYPIHIAMYDRTREESPEERMELIRFLMNHDRGGVSKTVTVSVCDELERRLGHRTMDGCLPLHMVNASGDYVDMAKILFDAYPEAILIRNDRGHLPVDCADRLGARERAAFLHTQLQYAREAENNTSERDDNGQLLLHRAMEHYNDISLGAVKLILKANPDAIGEPDYQGFTPLHLACRRGACDIVNYILGQSIKAVSAIAPTGNEGKLPIQLLWESDCVKYNPEFLEAIWRLIRAHPDCVRPV